MNSTPTTKPSRLPYAKWWPAVAGALLGVALRLLFSGVPGGQWSAMNPEFLLLAPFVVGAATVYVAERSARRSYRYYIVAGMLANVLFVAGTMAILIEGLICAILIVPLFAVCGAIGAAIMGAICRKANWPRATTLLAILALPLLLGMILPGGAGEPYIGVIERTVVVNAAPDAIWRQLHDTRDIKAAEVERGWLYKIGVPKPEYGVTAMTPDGPVRDVRMGKGIHFTQHAVQWEINKRVRWTYRFRDDSFPPGAMDDHVRIGGHYFDVIDSEFELTPLGAQATSMKIRMQYRVSTRFNWYAKVVAQGLISNFEEVIVDLYAGRATGGNSVAALQAQGGK